MPQTFVELEQLAGVRNTRFPEHNCHLEGQCQQGKMLLCSQALVERHAGQVPQTFAELEQLAGVGHKTASVVMAVAFKCGPT